MRFLDTNVLLYLLSADDAKAAKAEITVAGGGIISVQVLNEFTAVATRNLGMKIDEVREVLAAVRAACQIVPLDLATHDKALQIAERYHLSHYDALIAAAALNAGCSELLSEDLQTGQRIEGQLTIHNPFKP